MNNKQRTLIRKRIRTGADVVLALLITALILFPIIWIVPSAFKARGELFDIPNHFFPDSIQVFYQSTLCFSSKRNNSFFIGISAKNITHFQINI